MKNIILLLIIICGACEKPSNNSKITRYHYRAIAKYLNMDPIVWNWETNNAHNYVIRNTVGGNLYVYDTGPDQNPGIIAPVGWSLIIEKPLIEFKK